MILKMPISRATEWSWIAAFCLLLSLVFAGLQPVTTIGNGLGFDGHYYYAVAEHIVQGRLPEGPTPFVYRVGTPLLAATVSRMGGWPLAEAFDLVNLTANVLSVMLLVVWLRRHVADAMPRVIVVVFFMVEPHSPFRFAYLYPINVDPVAVTFLVLGLIGLDWFREAPGLRRALWMSLLVGVGVTCREVVLVIALAMLFVRSAGWASWVRGFAWLPILSGALAIIWIQSWVVVVPSAYTIWGTVQTWLRDKTVTQYVLAWFLVFGPLLIVPAYFAPATARALVSRVDWAVYVAALAVLAWIGGSDTERVLVFASPVVYLLMAKALARAELAPSPLMAGFVVAQLISSRVFVPIGRPLAPTIVEGQMWHRLVAEISWISSYESLWSLMLSRPSLLAFVLWYAALVCGVLACLWFRPGQRRARHRMMGVPFLEKKQRGE